MLFIQVRSWRQSRSPLICMPVIVSMERCHFVVLALLLYQCVCFSPRSLLLILSHSYRGRDENGCLIMQRGQPIKGPGPSDLKAHSEHSWRERKREGDSRGRETEMGWGLIAVWRAGHLSSTYHCSHSTNNCP